MGAFGVPKVVKFVQKIDIDCSFAAHQATDSYLAAMLMPKLDCDFSYDKGGTRSPESTNIAQKDVINYQDKPDANGWYEPVKTPIPDVSAKSSINLVLHQKIKLRGAVAAKHAQLVAETGSARKLGPALAGVLDTKTNKIYYGLNNPEGDFPSRLSPKMKARLDQMPQAVWDSYIRTKGAGSHAEIYALNEAWLARPGAVPAEFMLYVINAGGKASTRGMPIPRCPHCDYLTSGVNYIPEVMYYGKTVR